MSAAKLLRNGAGRALNAGDDDLGNAALSGADALEALAVPGVAELLADLSRARTVETWEPPTPDATSPGTGGMLTDEERAALAALAKIASEGK